MNWKYERGYSSLKVEEPGRKMRLFKRNNLIFLFFLPGSSTFNEEEEEPGRKKRKMRLFKRKQVEGEKSAGSRV
jgi:hypothetical protein